MTGDQDRRRFIGTAGVVLALPALGTLPLSSGFAHAQQAAGTGLSTWREFAGLAMEANRLGLSVPRLSANVQGGTEFNELMPAIVDFMQSAESSAGDSQASAADVEKLIEQTSDLLRRLVQAERSPRPDPDQPGAAVQGRPDFGSIKDDYVKLFNTCEIRAENQAEVNWYVTKLTDAAARKQYQDVADQACVPWYFVGIIHAMEAGFDFRSHLHNGDPLSKRTVLVPKGRPAVWNPPTDWVSSAKDALAYDGFIDQPDWSLAQTLYRWEAYNGFRSRMLHNINTPYLWSYSNHYTKGKFVADNVWDANAVSKQCGCAVMLKALVERGLAAVPA